MSDGTAAPPGATSTAGDDGHALDLLGRLGLMATGAAYVLGVLITNLHLAYFGFPPPELVQSRYFLVGGLWLALVSTALATCAWAWSMIGRRWRLGGFRNRAYGTVFAFSLILSVRILLSSTSNGNLRLVSAKLWLLVALLVAAAVDASVTIRFASALRVSIGQSVELRTYSIRHYGYQIVWGLVSLYLLTFVYARTAYPELPSAIGGGRFESVMLLSAAGGVDVMRRLSIPQRADGLFGPVETVAEDSNTYFLIYRTSERVVPVRLRKETCEGVLAAVH